MIPVRPSQNAVPAPRLPYSGPVPMPQSAAANALSSRTGLWKYCFECQGYFQGQLDGEYRCPACRTAGRTHERALAPLDSALTVMPESLSILPRPSPERVYAEIGSQQKATGS